MRAATWRDSLLLHWQWAAFPVYLFVFTRIALLGVSQIGMMVSPALWYPGGPREFLQHYPALDGLCRWDCGWFEQIARMGYSEARATNYFPLYPLLARALHELTGIHLHFALLIIPNLAGLGAYLVIYRIFAMLEGEEAAHWGLALFAAYPFAFFHAGGLSESPMIFCTALAIMLALRANHIWAGAALGLGVLAKQYAIFAGAALLVAQLRQRGIHPRRLLLSPAILGLLVPWLCLGLYCFYLYLKFGNPLEFWTVRAVWGPHAGWGIIHLVTTNDRDLDVQVMLTYLPFLLIPTAGALALATRKRWMELAAFTITLLLVIWFAGIWASGRHSASCWPAFLPLGIWLSKRPGLQAPIIGMLAVFQGLFFYLFTHQFPVL